MVATLQPEDIPCRPRRDRGGMRALAAAERRWPLIGWVRVTLGGNVGEGAAPGPPALGVIPVPI